MSRNATTHNSPDSEGDFAPLTRQNPVVHKTIQPQDLLDLLGEDVVETRFPTEELSVCRGGLNFVCSELAFFAGGQCWPHFLDEMSRPRATMEPPETCHLQDLLLTNNILADDGDATSAYDEGGDEGQYESSEADINAGGVEYEEDEDFALLLAASVPLPDGDEDDDLEEVVEQVEEPVEEVVESAGPAEDTGSVHLPGIDWAWPSEASVGSLVKRKADTRALLRIFPPAQGYTELADDRLKCNARAKISRATGRWEVCSCSKTFERQYDYRRHFLTIHLGGSRWEDVARQKKVDAEASTSTSTAALVPKKPRAKRVPRQTQQPLASTSASASTSTAGPPPEVQPTKLRQKRKLQVTEDEHSEDGDYGSWGQEESDRKGKKARRW